MNKEEPYRDQAERLKRRIDKINETVVDSNGLPPREEIHRQKKKKVKWKIKYPVIRLLVLFFILLPIIIFSVISYFDGKKINTPVKTSGESVGFETITLEKSKNTVEKSKGIAKKNGQSGGDTQAVKSGESSSQSKQEQPKAVTNPSPAAANQPPSEAIQQQRTNSTSQSTVQKDSNTSVETKAEAPQPVSSSSSIKVVFHTVLPKETLFSIAKKYFSSPATGVEIIKAANHLPNNNQIEVGEVLKIPLKK